MNDTQRSRVSNFTERSATAVDESSGGERKCDARFKQHQSPLEQASGNALLDALCAHKWTALDPKRTHSAMGRSDLRQGD